MTRLLAPMVLAMVALLTSVPAAVAQPGTGLATIATAPPCPTSGSGIGVAFDGTDILYTCSNEAKVRKTNLAGANLGSVNTADAGGNSVSVDAIAWDPNENRLWGGDLDGQGHCRIWSIDLGSGLATLRFSFTDPSGHCSFSFYDGITVDSVSNTLYLSADVNPTIRHFDKTGAPLPGDPIPFSALVPAGTCSFNGPSCLNSGLAIGLDGTLFAGTNGDGKIVEINPTVPSFLGLFSTVTGRDEDLECGPLFTKPNGSVVETILSRDFNTGVIDVLEAPKGTCVIFKITLNPPTATNPISTTHSVTANVTINGKADVGETVLFNVSGVSSASGNATTDAAGNAPFSYLGGATLGSDTITACADINKNSVCDPDEPQATATKKWIDNTPPTPSCVETTNPAGKNVPPAGLTLPGTKGGQNPDGFYVLGARDNLDPNPQIFVSDSGSSAVFGPFAVGDQVKITQAPGATPDSKPMAGVIVAHITLNGDALVFAVDFSGNTSVPVSCKVPPPPK